MFILLVYSCDFLAECTAHNMIGYWCHIAVCLSIRLWCYALWLNDTSYSRCVNRKCPSSNTILQLTTAYIDPIPSISPHLLNCSHWCYLADILQRRRLFATVIDIRPVLYRQTEPHQQYHCGKPEVVLCNCPWWQSIQRSIVRRLQRCECGGCSATAYEDASQVVATRRHPIFTSEVVRRHIRRHNRSISQPVISRGSVPCMLQDHTGSAITEEGWCWPGRSGEFQTDIKSLDRLQSTRKTSAGATTATSPEFWQLLSVPIRLSYQSLDRNGASRAAQRRLHSWRWSTLYRRHRPRHFSCVRYDQSQLTASCFVVSKPNSDCLPLCSYLSDRKQYVKVGQHSWLFDCCIGVPQGSVLGPLLFAAYASPVGSIIESFGVRYQQYADDTQLYLSMRADNCTHDLDLLRALHVRRLLNADKSDVIVFETAN